MPEKPRRKAKATILKTIFLPILWIAGLLLACASQSKAEEFVRREDTAVEVSAEIIRIEEYEDSDGDTRYNVYISYTYNGQKCERKGHGINGASRKVGQLVTIRIDSHEPMVMINEVRSSARGLSVFACIALFIGCTILTANSREGYCESFGISKENVHLDVNRRVWNRAGTCLGFAIVTLYLFNVVRWGIWHTGLYIVLAVFATLVVYSIHGFYKLMQQVKREEYEIRRDRVTDKKVTSDDDGTKYTLYFNSGENKNYWRDVTKKLYGQMKVGDECVAVWFEGDKKAYMNIVLGSGESIG